MTDKPQPDQVFSLYSVPPKPSIEILFEPHQDITPLEAAYIGQFYALAASHHMRPGDFDGWSLIERHFKVIEL